MHTQIQQTKSFLNAQGILFPEIGIVLGTGLGKFVNDIVDKIVIDYSDIPNFVTSTVEFHSGKLIYGTFHGRKLLAMQGRFHYYEGYSMQQITFPIRVMHTLGVKYLLLSNAAGAINPSFKKGSLMLLDDHINLLPDNPLRGPNIDELGPRFPDMSCPYSAYLNEKLTEASLMENIELHKGIYAAVMGPNLETRAEYRYIRTIGADVVGMSTVPEVLVANHMGLPCAAISVLTDECDPDNLKKVDISEIIAVAGETEVKLVKLLEKFLEIV